MFHFRCPVCGEALQRENSRWFCRNGHSYDIARQGYVNLLMSNRSSSRRHGDDRAMVLARTRFLERGYYECLRAHICALAVENAGEEVCLVDAGCGEGWYTVGVRQALEGVGKSCTAVGVDISRAALIQAARRDRELFLAIASVSSLPVPDGTADLLLNIFAPASDGEFFRVLKPGGILIAALPSEDHLFQLKSAIYDRPYRNPKPEYSPEGFELLKREEIRDRILLDSQEDIHNLFLMTPYYYKTGRADQEKLERCLQLETDIGFDVFVLRRKARP